MKKAALIIYIILNFTIVFAQKPNKINIEYADFFDVNEVELPGASLLTGNVRVKHDGIVMTCNKAYFFSDENYIKAFGDVHFVQGDTLHLNGNYAEYNGNELKAFVTGKVVMNSPESKLVTDTINFDRNKQEVYFNSNGTITNKENILKSKSGRYYANEKKYQFLQSVVLTNPKYTIKSNHLDYYTEQGDSYLYGPSTITGKDNFIYTENGYYNSKKNIGNFKRKSYIRYKDRLIEADSLYYDRKIEFASATYNVKITDSINKAIIKGHYGEVYKNKDSLYITKHASMRYMMEKDSMFIHAKKIIVTGKIGERVVRGFNNVRFYKTDLSGKCDSIHSSQKKGLTQLIGKPILWNFDNQLTGDLMHLIANNKTEKLDSLKVLKNTFIISKDTIGDGYNQIKGLNLYGKFIDNKLHEADVIKNTEVIYYMRNDKNELIGINKNVSSKINMVMDEKSNVETITFFDAVDGDIYPEKDLPPNARKLKGFVWRGDEQIKSKEDIFPPDEVELDRKIVEESRKKHEIEDLKLTNLLNKEKAEQDKYKVYNYELDTNFQQKNANTNTKITLGIIAALDDQFQLFYTVDNTFNFNEYESEKANIKGAINNQTVVFYLPNDIKITNLRIDPGENPYQEEIKINYIEIDNGITKFRISNKELFKYFESRNDIKYNNNGTITHLTNQKNSKIDPVLYCNSKLINELKKIFKNSKENLTFDTLSSGGKAETDKKSKYEYKLDPDFKPKNTNTNTKITLDILAKVDDQFQLFYTADNTFNFNEYESEKANIKGAINNQTVVFYLPNDIKITNLRIDPGENPYQKEIKINYLEIDNGITKLRISNKELFNYFEIRNDIKYNKSNGTITHLTKQKNSKIDPFLYCNSKLINELKKIFSNKN